MPDFTNQIKVTVPSGTAPFFPSSTQVCPNLNADLLDGQHGSYFLDTSSGSQTKAGALTVQGTFSSTGELYDASVSSAVHTGNVEAYYQVARRLQALSHLGSSTVLEIEAMTIGGFGYGGSVRKTTWRLTSRTAISVTRIDENGGVSGVALRVLNDGSVPDANGSNNKYVVGLICGSGSSFGMVYITARFLETQSTGRWTTVTQLATATPTTQSGSAMTFSSGWVANTGFSVQSITEVIQDERARVLNLTAASGTAPITVSSTTVCTNLNADLLDGLHASSFIDTSSTSQTKVGNLRLSGNSGSQLRLQGGSGVGFSLLSFSSNAQFAAGAFFNGTSWVHENGFSSNSSLLVFDPGVGVSWYHSSNSSASWNVANGILLWNTSGVVTASVSTSGSVSASTLASTVASGTPPITVSSVTEVANLRSQFASNLSGGSAGRLPYQTAANATAFLALGTAGQVLTVNSGATAPEWSSPSSFVDDNWIDGIAALGSTIKADSLGCPLFLATTAVGLSSQVVRFCAVYLNKAATLTGVAVHIKTAGNFTGNNFNGVAIYSYSGGTLTKQADSSNSGSWWQGSTGFVQIPFTSQLSASKGLYFVALMYSSSSQTTQPQLSGLAALDVTGKVAPLTTNGAKVHAVSLNLQTNLLSNYTSSTELSTTTGVPWVAVY